MTKITCPECGHVFEMTANDYAEVAKQVRNAEFEAELTKRMAERERTLRAEEEKRNLEAKQAAENELRERESKLRELQEQLAGRERDSMQALRDQKAALERQFAEQLRALETKAREADKAVEIARLEEQNRAKDILARKQDEINQALNESEQKLRDLKTEKEIIIRNQEQEIESLKSYRSRQSVKIIGENLEQHCLQQWQMSGISQWRPSAKFIKDNKAVETDISDRGSKGDFIFRDTEHGVEYLSIMFDMKDEGVMSVNKLKNETHFKKLDADRRAKGCEYAVLVSTLEADNEFYNTGIADVSDQYEKMFVIRPMMLIPFIRFMMTNALKTAQYKVQLQQERQKSIDVTNFEEKLEGLKDGFAKYVIKAHNKYDEAVAAIDTNIKALEGTIDKLRKVKDMLKASGDFGDKAKKSLDDITIKKLTRGNETMKHLFAEASRAEVLPDDTADELPDYAIDEPGDDDTAADDEAVNSPEKE